jgi:hypothetical protein
MVARLLRCSSDDVAPVPRPSSRRRESLSAAVLFVRSYDPLGGFFPPVATKLTQLDGQLGSPPTFSESFGSSGVVQLTSKEQCKDGGWQSLGFKNQGDCVSFVATGAKNPPSRS